MVPHHTTDKGIPAAAARLDRLWAARILRHALEAARDATRVDVVVPRPPAAAPRPPPDAARVCTVCAAAGLADRVATTPCYTDVAAKRRVRAAFVEFVRACGRPRPCLLVVDAWLPRADGATDGSYLCEDLLAAGIPGLDAECLFSPNVDPAVVAALRDRCGVVHTAVECCCRFLAQRRATIALHGGFAAVMADVWGGFDHGARRPLAWLAQRRLFDTAGAHGAGIVFCASDRHDRVAAGNVCQARDDVYDTLRVDVLGRNGYRAVRWWTPPHRDDPDPRATALPARYGRTMQTFAVGVLPRGPTPSAAGHKRPRET